MWSLPFLLFSSLLIQFSHFGSIFLACGAMVHRATVAWALCLAGYLADLTCDCSRSDGRRGYRKHTAFWSAHKEDGGPLTTQATCRRA